MKLILSALAALAAALPASASAHIALSQTEAVPGAYYVASFRVGHGCEAGAATTAIRVELPPGIDSAKPQPKPDWAFARDGRSVSWTGRLEDDQFEVFSLLVRLPATEGPIYFPTVQTCGAREVRWTEIPAPGAAWTSTPHPAPVVELKAAAPATGAAAPAHQH